MLIIGLVLKEKKETKKQVGLRIFSLNLHTCGLQTSQIELSLNKFLFGDKIDMESTEWFF